jgi:hypothetical protein
MQSLIHEWSDEDGASDAKTQPSDFDEGYKAQYLRPYHAASVVDPRLDDIEPSKWTTVNTDDNLMRTLIRAYFFTNTTGSPFCIKITS